MESKGGRRKESPGPTGSMDEQQTQEEEEGETEEERHRNRERRSHGQGQSRRRSKDRTVASEKGALYVGGCCGMEWETRSLGVGY